MALSLPYPNMDFVPLDILTAQEQDQLVANIEYIANQFPVASANLADGSISTAKIANGAVTNAKIGSSAVKSNNIDWTTLNAGITETKNCPSNSDTLFTVSIPTMANTNYKVLLSINSAGAYWGNLRFQIASKATTNFVIDAWNDNGQNIPDVSFAYFVLP